MNFLSHLYLSGNSEELLIGNFIADSVKGSDYKKFSYSIQQGILLHRKIDTFTDSHQIVALSKERLYPKYKKYSSVIIDVYYDHFLAINWNLYAHESLTNYVQRIYLLIQKNENLLPEKSAQFTKYMLYHNILEAYARLDGIEQVLRGMAHRAKFESNMEKAIEELKEHYTLFEQEFKLFFPELQTFVKEEIILLNKKTEP